MKATLASPEAFKAAGLDYATPLLGIRFAIDKRASGAIDHQTDDGSSLNEPFVDMLLEINWSSGRLVREYTFLLDPPEVATKGPCTGCGTRRNGTGKTAVNQRAALVAPAAEASAPGCRTKPRPSAKPKAAEQAGNAACEVRFLQGEERRHAAQDCRPASAGRRLARSDAGRSVPCQQGCLRRRET